MKKLFFVIIYLNAILCYGQDTVTTDSEKVKCMKVTELFLQAGISFERYAGINVSDFRSLAPSSQLLTNSFTNYSSYGPNGYTVEGNGVSSVMIGISFNDKEQNKIKSNPLLRVGFNYYVGNIFSYGLNKTDTKRVDTLVSPQTGNIVYVDSIYTDSYQMNYSSEQIRADASLIYQLNLLKRWKFYAGAGFNCGFSFNSLTNISHFEENTTQKYYSTEEADEHPRYGVGKETENETFINRNAFCFAGYIPLGVDLVLGKKREFLKQFHVYYEMRPGLNITAIPELKTFTNSSFTSLFGIKIDFSNNTNNKNL